MFKLFLFIIAVTVMSVINLPSLAVVETLSHTAASVDQKTATKTVTLSVLGMTCRVCPITVKKALANIKGVSQVSVNFDAKTVTVTFNPNQTNVPDLIEATKKSGYPSSLQKKL